MARRFLFLTLLLAIVLCYLNIGGISIYILDEAKNATCAKEMFFGHDIVVPTFNGQLRGDKPPLHYFFMMTAYAMFGVTEFAARFFSAFMGVVTFIACILFVRRYFGSEVAGWTATGFLSSLMFMFEFHLSVPDPYLIAFILLANICFFVFYYEGRRLILLPGYIFLAMAVLAKGPVAIVLTVLGWLLFIWFSRQNLWKTIRAFQLHWGIPLLLLIALPWFVAVHLETSGAWTEAFFLDHNISRYAATREGHGGIPLLSLVLLLLVMFPLGLLVPRVTWEVLRKRTTIILIFLVCMGLSPMIFFLFSQTVLPNYVMPGVPFLVMALTAWLYYNADQYALRGEWIILLLLGVAMPAGAYFGIRADAGLAGLEYHSLWLLIFPIAIGLRWFVKERLKAFLLVALGAITVFCLICLIILPRIDDRNPVKLSEELWQKPVHKRYYQRINPSYIFYLDDPVELLEDLSANVPEPVMIFSRSEFTDSLNHAGFHELFRQRNLFEKGETIIYGSASLQSGDVANR